MTRTPLLLCGLLAAPSVVTARQAPKQMAATRVATAPSLDGKLDDAVWSRVPVASDFTQEWPERGRQARQKTEVRVLYDDHYLYVGARMHHDRILDGGKARVVRRVHRRDQDSQGDWFGVAVDSLHDHRTALLFEVNAGGVQRDQVVFNDNQFDASWDGVWESEVSVDEDGWTAELRIPLSILRIAGKGEAQSWGINFNRGDQGAVREFTRWSVVPRGENAFVSRFPELTGLEGLRPQRRMEWIPFLSSARKFETTQPFDDRRWETKAGLDAHLGLTPHSQVDLAVRPDFGQVEVDQAVLNLSTVETFFPEKRAFFLEGSEIFRVAGPDLFYSRRIGQAAPEPELGTGESLVDRPLTADITAAAKYTAKYGTGTNAGLLLASVAPARAEVRGADGRVVKREVAPLTNFGVLRVQQMLDNRGSYLGGFASLMRQAGDEGRTAQVAAVDGVYRTADRSGLLESTLSRSQAGPRNDPDQGWRFRVRARREWKSGWSAEWQGLNAGRAYDPNDVGFLPRADERRTSFFLNRNWDRTAGVFRNWGWNFATSTATDQRGRTFNRWAELNARTDFTSFWSLWGGVGANFPTDDDRELRTFHDPVKKYLHRDRIPYANLGFDTPGNNPWYLRMNVGRAWQEGGPSTDWSLFQVLKPGASVEFQLDTTWTENTGERSWLDTLGSLPGGPGQASGTPVTGLRRLRLLNQVVRASYAYSPTLTVQLFSQWLAGNWNYRDLRSYAGDGALAAGLPADVGSAPQTAYSIRSWNLNFITRWQYRPGSTFYLVYTHGTFTDQLINDRASLSPVRDLARLRNLPSDDVVQMKVSYLFR